MLRLLRPARHHIARNRRVRTLFVVLGGMLLLSLAGCDEPERPRDPARHAEQLLRQGDAKAAVIELKNALQKNPDDHRLRLLLGRVYLAQQDYAGAEKEISRAAEGGALPLSYFELLAEALYARQRYRQLLDRLPEDLVAAGSRHWVELQVLRGKAQRELGLGQEAAQSFNGALFVSPGHATALVGLATVALDQDNRRKAKSLLDAAIKAAPLDYEAWAVVGRLHFSQGNYGKAGDAYRRSLETAEDPIPARLGLAWSYLAMKRLDEAVEHALAVRALRPRHPMANYLLAAAAFEQEQYERANEYLYWALTAAPDDPKVLLLAAANSFQFGKPAQAEAHLREFLALRPDFIPAQTLLAEVRVLQGQAGKAYRGLVSVAKRLGMEQELSLHLARLALHDGATKEAKDWLALVRGGYQDPAARAARAKLNSGFLEQAREQLDTLFPVGGARREVPVQRRPELEELVALLRAGEFQAAELRASELAVAGDADARNLLGVAQAGIGDLESARRSFEQAAALAGEDSPGPRLNLAWLDIAVGELDSARERLEQLGETAPRHTGVLKARARLAEIEKRPDDAIDWLRRSLEVDPASVSVRTKLTRLLLMRDDVDGAREVIEPAFRLQPETPAVVSLVALVEERTGEPDKARAQYRELIESNPEVGHLGLARIDVSAGQADEATEQLKKLLDIEPGNLNGIQLLMRLRLLQRQDEEALKLARQLQQKPANALLGQLLEADVRFVLGDYHEAARLYQAVYDVAPTMGLARSMIQARQQAGQDRSLTALEGWVRGHPQNVPARQALAAAYLRAARPENALRELTWVETHDPGNPAALNNLAITHARLDNKPLAAQYAERAYRADPGNASVADTWGWLLVQTGRSGEAIELLQQAVEGLPGHPEVHYHLAIALADSGRLQKALEHLDYAFDNGAGFAEQFAAAQTADEGSGSESGAEGAAPATKTPAFRR